MLILVQNACWIPCLQIAHSELTFNTTKAEAALLWTGKIMGTKVYMVEFSFGTQISQQSAQMYPQSFSITSIINQRNRVIKSKMLSSSLPP